MTFAPTDPTGLGDLKKLDRLSSSAVLDAVIRNSPAYLAMAGVVRAVEPGTLLAEVCRILVTTGEFAAAAFLTHVSSTGHLVARSTCHSRATPGDPPRGTDRRRQGPGAGNLRSQRAGRARRCDDAIGASRDRYRADLGESSQGR